MRTNSLNYHNSRDSSGVINQKGLYRSYISTVVSKRALISPRYHSCHKSICFFNERTTIVRTARICYLQESQRITITNEQSIIKVRGRHRRDRRRTRSRYDKRPMEASSQRRTRSQSHHSWPRSLERYYDEIRQLSIRRGSPGTSEDGTTSGARASRRASR